MARVCSEAKRLQQLWRSLNTLMGAGEKNNLPRKCPSAQEFVDFLKRRWQQCGKLRETVACQRNFSGRQKYLITLKHVQVLG